MPRLLGCLLLLGLLLGCAREAVPLPAPTPRPTASAPLSSPPSAPSSTPPPVSPSPSPLPSATATVTPTPQPALRQLMTGGCCANPMWRPDGQAIHFLDRPTQADPVGIYEVSLAAPAPLAVGALVTTTLGNWDSSGYYLAPEGEGVRVQAANGESWWLPTGGSLPSVAPDGAQVAWLEREDQSAIPFNERVGTIWLAPAGGGEAERLLSARGLLLAGWIGPQDLLFLLPDDNEPAMRLLLRYRLADGATTRLGRAPRINGLLPSPDGRYLVYFTSLGQGTLERNGLWLTHSESGESAALPFVGAYQWRDATRLLVIPMELDAVSHRLQEYDIRTGTLRDLTEPNTRPFKVRNNDWAVAPDGSAIVFVSAWDDNLWLLDLAP